jgi:hypothetical protein
LVCVFNVFSCHYEYREEKYRKEKYEKKSMKKKNMKKKIIKSKSEILETGPRLAG